MSTRRVLSVSIIIFGCIALRIETLRRRQAGRVDYEDLMTEADHQVKSTWRVLSVPSIIFGCIENGDMERPAGRDDCDDLMTPRQKPVSGIILILSQRRVITR